MLYSITKSSYVSVMISYRLLHPMNLCRFRGFLVTSGSLYLGSRFKSSSQANSDPSHSPNPPITLYQYQSCPFCAKTRAFLDYNGIAYKKVEVNPLFKREMKFSSYRKVPFIIVDGVQINDSSLLISVLRSSALLSSSVSEVLEMYPEMKYSNDTGKEQVERANKYFIMYGEDATDGKDVDQRREERQWREWVDTRMVHTLSPNIYRSPREALQSFDYISQVGNFNVVERLLAKYIGALVMYFLSKQLKKKYALKDDVRQSLYDCCDEWIEAIGEHREFMGGDSPNLGDVAVYGVLSAIEGLDTFNDMLTHTKIRKWYYSVKDRVDRQEGLNTI